MRYISENEEDSLTLQEPPPKAYLTLLVGGQVSHNTFPLRGEIQLGREKGNAIVVADRKVSRNHAVLTPIDDTFIVRDQGSANGTYVNGVLIGQPTRLQDKDKVALGDTTFLFTTRLPTAKTLDQPVSAPITSPPPQPALQGSVPVVAENNRPIWITIGCMALAIVALMIILALMFGLFLGRGQFIGLMLLGLAGVV